MIYIKVPFEHSAFLASFFVSPFSRSFFCALAFFPHPERTDLFTGAPFLVGRTTARAAISEQWQFSAMVFMDGQHLLFCPGLDTELLQIFHGTSAHSSSSVVENEIHLFPPAPLQGSRGRPALALLPCTADQEAVHHFVLLFLDWKYRLDKAWYLGYEFPQNYLQVEPHTRRWGDL